MENNVRKAMVLTSNASLEVQQRDVVRPSAGQVEVLINRAGVCSSDITRGFGNGAYHYPLVMGHELAGTITCTFEDDQSFKQGDRVAIFPLLPCFECFPCKSKRYALCKDYSYYGSRQDGGFATHLICNSWNLMKIPDSVSMDDAALVEPLTVVMNAVKKLEIDSWQDDNICIIGAGFLGLLAVMYFREFYPKLHVTLIDRNSSKLDVGERLGANVFNLKSNDGWKKFVAKNRDRYSKIIELVGAPETFCNSIELCSQGGSVVWVGNIQGNVNLSEKLVSTILRKELTILGSWNSRFKGDGVCDWAEAISIMSMGFKPSKLITNRVSLDELPGVLEQLYNHKIRKQEFVTTKIMTELGS